MTRGIEFIGGGDLAVEQTLEELYELLVKARGDLIRLEAAAGTRPSSVGPGPSRPATFPPGSMT